MEALRRGNKDVFKDVYKTHFGMVRYFILKNGGSESDSEDVFQETLVAFYKNCLKPSFTLSVKLKTYLYSIARNVWFSELKKREKRNEKLLSTEEFVAIESPDHTTEDDKENLLVQMHKAMETLGEKCRQILVMFYFEKQSMQMIADQLEYTNAENVKNQKYKCLQQLKRKF
ncbi:MAG: RNA polymerase sigma factor (sigma-70 family) [Bacteroidia bacterium]